MDEPKAEKRKFPDLGWEIYALAAIMIFSLALQQVLISGFLQLPSPIYGGDFYFQMGSITHIMEGGSPLESPNMLGSEPAYFIVYSVLVAWFGNLLSLSASDAMFYFSQLLLLISVPVVFLVFLKIFNDKRLALLGVVMYIPLYWFPVLKYTEFTRVLVMPLFFLSVYYFIRERSIKSAAITGLIAGIANISHGSSIFVTTSMLLVLFAGLVFFRFVSFDFSTKSIGFRPAALAKSLKKNIPLFAIIFLVAMPITMIYWYKPFFVYHGQTLNDVQTWSFTDLSVFGNQIKYASQVLTENFMNLGNVSAFVISLLSILGIYMLFRDFRYNALDIFMLSLLVATFVGTFHYFITQPITGTHFFPPRIAQFYFPFLLPVLAVYGLSRIDLKDNMKLIVMGLVLFITIFNYLTFANISETDIWFANGRTPLPDDFSSMQSFVMENTGANNVFLSSNELSFALNSLTGRKTVISRRAHNSAFVDMETRQADAAVMLYGNNSDKTRELLEKYSVGYLYWNNYWIQSEYQFDSSGQITSWFDPILVKDLPEYRSYFEENGVQYFPINTWIDPAQKGEDIKKTDILLVIPNYKSLEQPWNDELNKYIGEIWNYEMGNATIARIYEVNYQ